MSPDEITRELAETSARSKSNTHRLDDVERRQDDLDKLVTSVAALANEQGHIKDDVTEIKTDVKSLKDRPAKRWDSIVDKALLCIVAAIVAYMLAHVGL